MINKSIVKMGGVPLLGLFLLSFGVAEAESWTDRTSITGFYSARFSATDNQTYFHGDEDSGINKEGSFQGTKIGLTIRSQLSDKLSVATLLMSDDKNNYTTHADWAFATYRLNNTVSLRAGKIKFPVGLVNEYVDVGVTYPWITAPVLLYSDEFAGAQATREAYTGGSILWEKSFDDWNLTADFFGGQVDLEGMTVKKLLGTTLRANWDDTLELQASTYQGQMHATGASMVMMNEKTHKASTIGAKLDWNNVIAYFEMAKITMDVTMVMMGEEKSVGDSDSWYATLGYKMGDFLPHFTQQQWDRGNGSNHKISTVGVSYHLNDETVLKAELSTIKTDNYAANPGLFSGALTGDSTNMASFAVDVVF